MIDNYYETLLEATYLLKQNLKLSHFLYYDLLKLFLLFLGDILF